MNVAHNGAMYSPRVTVMAALIFASACGSSGSSPTGPTPSAPVVTQVSPIGGGVGDVITITGTGFASTGNAAKLGAGYSIGLSSSDTTTLKFTIPNALGACPPTAQVCTAVGIVISPGPTTLAVVNANGTSNAMTFTVVAK